MLCAATAGAKDRALADEADAHNWPAIGRAAGETHYSPLTEINRDTVGRLRLAWVLDLDVGNAQATPLAIDGIIYVGAGYSIVHAIDARTGKPLWRFDPEVLKVAGKKLRAGQQGLLERLLGYRVFPDAEGRMNRSLRDVGGGLLLVIACVNVASLLVATVVAGGVAVARGQESARIAEDGEKTMVYKKLQIILSIISNICITLALSGDFRIVSIT